MTTELETVVMVIVLKGKQFFSDNGLLSQYICFFQRRNLLLVPVIILRLEPFEPAHQIMVLGPDRQAFSAYNCEYFLSRQFEHIFWVLKRTVSLRRFF